MTGGRFIGAIDQGTTGTRFMVFDGDGHVVTSAYANHRQHYPRQNWVEHDPQEIWENTTVAIHRALDVADIDAADLTGLGVTNQRETAVVWDAETGEPLHNAIVWRDRRTIDRIEELHEEGKAAEIRSKTGLELDPYFSASKFEWLLDHAGDGDLRAAARDGEVCCGTMDAWLLFNLTGRHVTEVTNASRTMLFNVHELDWDDDLLDEFGVPRESLPEVRPSSDDDYYGTTDSDGFLGAEVPVAGALGDQQAALFGQACFDAGQAKNTTGTGSFFLLNTGEEPVESDHGLLTTVAFQRSGEPVQYALEGAVFTTGAGIEWLEEVGVIDDPTTTEQLARSVDSTEGVYMVPAFTGLGAPFWNRSARGNLVGLTRDTKREHIVRAAVEAITYRTRDVVEAVDADSGPELETLKVDGATVKNDFLCQLQADVLQTDVVRPEVDETTALGAAYAAGLAVGFWDDLDELRSHWRADKRFTPSMDATVADDRYDRWSKAVEQARDWDS
ncbi:glycerol kinase GlpK [Haloarculaceae archaeon H-GB2-1]|nr:glycerol kinase GlpK [Haloarculaceae archaeon H-GB1-1]MEA5408095.1 glycerol kinase GlpK [Haloarculaceae archaeon H-GB2-1]